MAKYTIEDYQKRLDKIDFGYDYISGDVKQVSGNKVKIKCRRCGHVMEKASSFVSCNRRGNCSNCRVWNYKTIIANSFPIRKDGRVYELLSVDEYDKTKRTYFISVIDDEGYKYKTEYNKMTNKNFTNYRKFFYHNPYTRDNIYNFMKLNNIADIEIPKDISAYKAITPMNVKIKGIPFKVSWNDISNNPNTFSVENIDTYTDYCFAKTMSKRQVIQIIFTMYEAKGAPLTEEDFEGRTTNSHIGVRLVEKYFGGIKNMCCELGLPINDRKILSDEELLNNIRDICQLTYENDRRTVITSNDFLKYGIYQSIRPYTTRCKQMGVTLRDIITSLGYKYQTPGNGMNFDFNDGEHVSSNYEYEFSNYLRNKGFVYNKTYFRDYKYSEIDDEYTGQMNCDYKILLDEQPLYVELAGILGNSAHETAYKNNTPISSKSKELYRQKLNQKAKIFDRNGLKYYILLPSQMNENTYKTILTQNNTMSA